MKHYEPFVKYMTKCYFIHFSPVTKAHFQNERAVIRVLAYYDPKDVELIRKFYFGELKYVSDRTRRIIQEYEEKVAHERGLI